MSIERIASALGLAAAIFAASWGSPAYAQEPEPEAAQEEPRKSSSRFPDDVEGLDEVARQAIAEDNGLRLLQATILLRRQQPYAPRHQVNMVRAYAMLGKPTSAYHYMLQMQQQGLSYDFDQLEETINLHGTEVYDYINDLLIRAGEPAGEAEPAFEIDADHAFPTAIAWDESRERFLVGTARDGALLAVSEAGKAGELIKAEAENGLWAIMDIEVDEKNNRLWISSAAIPQFSGYSSENAGKSGLFEFELDSLKSVGRYLVDGEGGPHVLGPIALDPDGDVYVGDRENATLYIKKAESDRIAPFVAEHELTGFRDVAISPDGTRIYLADNDKGILVIDPESETSAMLEGPDTLNLGGIEGLFHIGSELIIVQPGIQPQRVMALQLDPTGGKVQEVRPMAIALPWFDGPSRGTVRGDSVYYFADAALPEPGTEGEEVTVLRTALDAGKDIVAPDMRKFEEETLSKARDN